MQHRSGGKFNGNHTSFIDLAADLVDIANNFIEVYTISAGFIKNGSGVTGGTRRVKFSNIRGGIKLTVRQSRSVQEVWIYTHNPQNTKLALAKRARDSEIAISFKG